MTERFVQAYAAHLRVPEAWRGNCLCGKWLVVLRAFTSERPLRCACGRDWRIEGDRAVFEECAHAATFDSFPAVCARCGKELG